MEELLDVVVLDRMPDGQADELFVHPTRTYLIEVQKKGKRSGDSRTDRSIQILGKTVRHPGINQQMGRVVRDQDILDPCSLRVKGPRKKKQKGKNETDG